MTGIAPSEPVAVSSSLTFHVPRRLQLVRRLGASASGYTCCFKDTRSGQKLTVRKANAELWDPVVAKVLLKEVKLLNRLSHENIQSIVDLLPPPRLDFQDLYIVTEHMDTDLHKVICSKQTLSDAHFQYFSYQILRGLKYLHSAGVVHARLKPAAILVNRDCDLKIADFSGAVPWGLIDEEPSGNSSRWYTAPEVVLLVSCSPAADLWAAGCIVCEMLGRKPVFRGRDLFDQVKKIISVLGTPPDSALLWLPEQCPARSLLKKVPESEGRPWTELYPQATAASLTFVRDLLQFDPAARPDARAALKHGYLVDLHELEDEPEADVPFDWDCTQVKPVTQTVRNHFYLECASFREELLVRDGPELEKQGVLELLHEQKAKGWYCPQWRPRLQAHWRLLSLAVLKSEDPGLRAIAAATTEWVLRLLLVRFFLPAHLQCCAAPGTDAAPESR